MGREYPAKPLIGVLAMVRRGERFLLVRRGHPPNQGFWGFPGGAQELGETVTAAASRELAEETGVKARDPEIVTVLDAIQRDADGRVQYHFTLIAVLLRWVEGEGQAADDAEALGWFRLDDLPAIPALPDVSRLMGLVLDGHTGPFQPS